MGDRKALKEEKCSEMAVSAASQFSPGEVLAIAVLLSKRVLTLFQSRTPVKNLHTFFIFRIAEARFLPLVAIERPRIRDNR